ncbi:MAG: hypothetical protein GY869_00235 [Planctomycetes bacterium]|nr:hypothetical protein [Planctomycetota bacterium]
MTDQIRQMDQADCMIVAPGDWPERIGGQLQRRFVHCGREQQMMVCRDIYEAAAQIMELHSRGGVVLVYVLVDSMPDAEMQFFSCWSENEKVRTVALSVGGRQGKLSLALSCGADEAMILNGRKSAQALKLTPPVVEAPPPVVAIEEVAPAVLDEVEADEPIETESIEENNEPVSPVRQETVRDEPVTSREAPQDQVAEPLLTDEELNALLS